jgi:hypothetical protein
MAEKKQTMPRAKGMKAKALILNTDFTGEFKDIRINDGWVTIDDKIFDVGDIEPIVVKSFKGYNLLYVLKWDCLVPMALKEETIQDDVKIKKMIHLFSGADAKDKYSLKTLQPVGTDFYKAKDYPKKVKNLIEFEFLREMSMYPEGKKMSMPNVLFIVIALIFGMVWMWALHYFKIF